MTAGDQAVIYGAGPIGQAILLGGGRPRRACAGRRSAAARLALGHGARAPRGVDASHDSAEE